MRAVTVGRKACGTVGISSLGLLMLFLYVIKVVYEPMQREQNEGTAVLSDNEINVLQRLKGPLDPDDSALVKVVRTKFLHPPPSEPFSPKQPVDKYGYRLMYPSWILIDSLLTDLYSEKHPGPTKFFVEAGALDGEFTSNTLRLEQEHGWTGLLVEPDADNYMALKKVHRKAWLSPTCLSQKPFPYTALLMKIREKAHNADWLRRGTTTVMKDANDTSALADTFIPQYGSAQCLPIQTLLMALNVTHVDFFSLDVENSEMDVLHHFPFDKVTVDLWAIEHRVPNHNESMNKQLVNVSLSQMKALTSSFSKEDITKRDENIRNIEDKELVLFMQSRGYYFLDILCTYVADYIFVRKASSLYENLLVPKYKENRTEICKDKPIVLNRNSYPLHILRDPHHYPSLAYET